MSTSIKLFGRLDNDTGLMQQQMCESDILENGLYFASKVMHCSIELIYA